MGYHSQVPGLDVGIIGDLFGFWGLGSLGGKRKRGFKRLFEWHGGHSMEERVVSIKTYQHFQVRLKPF